MNKLNSAIGTIKKLKGLNLPQRKYVRKDSHKIVDRQSKIKSTLLEYGQQNILLSSIAMNQQEQQSKNASTLKQIQEQQNKVQMNNAEENNLKKLIDEMSDADQKRVSIYGCFLLYLVRVFD